MQDENKLLDSDAQSQSDNMAALGFITATAKKNILIVLMGVIIATFSFSLFQSYNREKAKDERNIELQKEKDQIIKEYLEYAKSENKYREKLLEENLAIQAKQNQINKELDKVKDQVEH